MEKSFITLGTGLIWNEAFNQLTNITLMSLFSVILRPAFYISILAPFL